MKLGNPAPYASETPGLAFGNTTVKPYNKKRPHMGKDYKWSVANVAKSRQVHASGAGIIRAAYNDGGNHNGWGNYIDLHLTTEAFTRLAHHATGSVKVRNGQVVAEGARLGTMGDTGEAPGGVHLHEELHIKQSNGSWKRVNPDLYRGPNGRDLPGRPLVSPTLDDDQRRTKAQTVRRIGAPSVKAKTGTSLAKGVVGNFVGFIRGDSVNGNNIWYKGISGDFFHSATFEGSYKGLKDLGTYRAPEPPKPTTPPKPPTPTPVFVPEEEGDMRPTVHFRTSGAYDMTLVHPEIGKDLQPFTGDPLAAGVRRTENVSAKTVVNTYLGFMATNDPAVGGAWARMFAEDAGKETSRTGKAEYEAIQREASRVAAELNR